MIKLNADVSKKVPIPDQDFSSQQFSAGMEVEVASGASSEDIRCRLQSLYALLEAAIDEQIESRREPESVKAQVQPSKRDGKGRDQSANGGNGSRSATKAQVKAIYAIAREQGYSDQDMGRLIGESFGAQDPESLSIGQASELIDTLKTEERKV